MAFPPFNTSQDGRQRASFRIEFRVGRDTLVAVAAKRRSDVTSKAALEEVIRETLRENGMGCLWTEDIPNEDWEWAKELITKWYPEVV